MVGHLDVSVGRVLQTLRELNLEEKTLIVCFSDNGGPTRELTSSNAPLRGGKGQLWEGGIRIPFLIQWKNHLPAGKVFNHPIISLDVLPTILAAARASLPDNLDGTNLLPHLTGKKLGPPHQQLFWRYGRQAALREGDWKWVHQIERGDDTAYLYNLADDPEEQDDLAGVFPDRAAAMQKAWNTLNATHLPQVQ
jgi:arylsulfatase B